MDDILKQDLKKQYDVLPKQIQEAISDIDLPAKLQEIVRKNKLMIDQAGKLETETVLVLFGLEPLENYIKNLVKNVGLTNIQASLVAHDINEAIFKNIRESLKKINEQVFEETQGQQNKITSSTLSSLIPKTITESFHQNISPTQNIVEDKLNKTIIIPKENIVIEEKDKLPEKSEIIDPYREAIDN
ncbi:MAG: hypothetical protein V1910_01450 [bacterium]